MELLLLDAFINHLRQFPSEDFVSPSDCSKLHLLITELLIDHYVELPLLKFLSRFLLQQVYDDIIEERNIEHYCGYVLCDQAPSHQVRKLSSGTNDYDVSTKFQISNRKPSIILPNTYLSQYCCKEHYQASLFYRNQLSNEALFTRKSILIASPFPQDYPSNWYENGITSLEDVISKHNELKDKGKSLSEVITMMNGLSLDLTPSSGTNQLIKLIQDFEIMENETVPPEEPEDPPSDIDPESMSSNVEGYITTNQHFGGYVV